MTKAPPVATQKPAGLIGVINVFPCEKNDSTPQPMTVPPIPMASVATAPPGSLPGMMAFASRPVSVPKPTHSRMILAQSVICCINSGESGMGCSVIAGEKSAPSNIGSLQTATLLEFDGWAKCLAHRVHAVSPDLLPPLKHQHGHILGLAPLAVIEQSADFGQDATRGVPKVLAYQRSDGEFSNPEASCVHGIPSPF